jgi:inner membrane protein
MLELLNPNSAIFWFAVGTALAIVEVLLPSFLALGFGIGGWLVAIAIWVAPSNFFQLPVLLLIWAIFSAGSWIVLRSIFKNKHSGSDGKDGDINEY